MADYENFNTRLKVETTFSDGVTKDHRGENHDFVRQEYFRNQQNKTKTDTDETPAGGFPPMKSCIRGTKPKAETKQVSRKKTKADLDVEKANKKDLNERNLKNQ